jgi:hypothetical protein
MQCRLPRGLAFNPAKLAGSQGSTQGKLKQAEWNDVFLSTLLNRFGKAHMG